MTTNSIHPVIDQFVYGQCHRLFRSPWSHLQRMVVGIHQRHWYYRHIDIHVDGAHHVRRPQGRTVVFMNHHGQHDGRIWGVFANHNTRYMQNAPQFFSHDGTDRSKMFAKVGAMPVPDKHSLNLREEIGWMFEAVDNALEHGEFVYVNPQGWIYPESDPIQVVRGIIKYLRLAEYVVFAGISGSPYGDTPLTRGQRIGLYIGQPIHLDTARQAPSCPDERDQVVDAAWIVRNLKVARTAAQNLIK